MRVNRFLFLETDAYHDIHYRGYTLQFDQGHINAAIDATNGGNVITPTTIAKPLAGVVTPATDVGERVEIPYGWGNKRFTFMLEVEHQVQGMSVYDIMSGYTDHNSLSHNGLVDPNMRLYLNNMTRVRTRHVASPNGIVEVPNAPRTAQVLNHLEVGHPSYGSPSKFTLRPEDIFFAVGGGVLTEDNYTLNAPTTTFAMGAKAATRSETNTTAYMANILNAFAHHFGQLDPNHSVYANVSFDAAQDVSSVGLNNNVVVNKMSGALNAVKDGFFTYQQLVDACPESDQVLQIIRAGKLPTHEYGNPNNFHHTNGADINSVSANLLSNTLSGIMSDSLLTRLVITGTNYAVGGHEPYTVKVFHAEGFSDKINIQQVTANLINRVKHELMHTLTINNALGVNFRADINLIYDSHITLSFDGGPDIEYCFPTFSDGLFSPFITAGNTGLVHMSDTVEKLAQNMGLMGYTTDVPMAPPPQPYPQPQPVAPTAPHSVNGTTSNWR